MEIEPDQIWMIVLGFLIAFVLAFGIGANDVANSFGTSVGSQVLNLRQACILASIFETLGAVLLGAKVSDTIRKGIIDIEPYHNNTELLMVGNVAALSGSCVWLMAATVLRMPVSATHSIVGATVGFALVAHGSRGINWTKFAMIIGSWFISPVLAGIVSTGLFYFCKFFILSKVDPLEPGLTWLPVFYAFTIAINMFSVFYDGPEMLHFDKIPLWGTFVIAFGTAILVALLVKCVLVPWLREKIKGDCKTSGPEGQSCLKVDPDKAIEPAPKSGTVAETNIGVDGNTDLENGHPPAENRRSSLLPPTASSKIMTEITHPDTHHRHPSGQKIRHPSGQKTRHPSGQKTITSGINKHDNASLMDNEYKLGQATPKSVTVEDLPATVKGATRNTAASLADSATPITNGVVHVVNGKSAAFEDEEEEEEGGRSSIQDRPETAKLFSVLQILTAVFGSFAHGGNDVSNAIGPLVSLWLIGSTGVVSAKAATPIWILFYGGAGISIGLWIWGRRVIKTLGEDLTKITPSSGFCIELGSALTVLVASNVGIPISTTHCKVGSVVFVGRFRARENVDWTVFRNIVLAWLVTLPITGGISAAMMAGLMLTVPH